MASINSPATSAPLASEIVYALNAAAHADRACRVADENAARAQEHAVNVGEEAIKLRSQADAKWKALRDLVEQSNRVDVTADRSVDGGLPQVK